MSSSSPSTSSQTAPASDAQTNLGNFYSAVVVVTAYCHETLNTSMTYPDTPVPDWFTSLSNDLATAQTHAGTWIDTIGPSAGSTVPQSIINYNTTFQDVVSSVESVLEPLGKEGTLSASDLAEIKSLLASLLSSLETEKSTMTALQSQLVAFSGTAVPPTGIMGDGHNLSAHNGVAEKALDKENTNVKILESKIAALQTKLQQDSKSAAYSGAGIGLAIFFTIVAVAVVVATGGLAAVVVGLCVVGVGTAIGFTVVY